MIKAEPLGISEEDRALIERVREIAAAQRAFVKARAAMNAARPDTLTGTPAERALYQERYQADNEAERAVRVLALEFARDADALLSARSQPIGVARVHSDEDVEDDLNFIEAALSWYGGTVAAKDVNEAWSRLCNRLRNSGIPQ